MAVHAAAADPAAQRVLVEDLTTSCRSLLTGRTVELPAASSWLAWVEYLAAGMPGVDLGAEREFWLDLLSHVPAGRGTRSGERLRHLGLTLDTARTAALRRTQRTLRVGWREVVLSALATALAADHTLIDVVGNARKAGLDGFDLSRAVGRYDTVHPVVLGPAPDPAAVREALRAVPHQGLGYGVLRHLHGPSVPVLSRVSSADVLVVDDGMATAGASRGPLRMVPADNPPQGSAGHSLTVRYSRRAGELRLDWIYDPAGRAEDEVAELRDRTEAALVSFAGE
jgi:phthiocerol/phenolphthiocerol synthesis type-I polyketide synthase E